MLSAVSAAKTVSPRQPLRLVVLSSNRRRPSSSHQPHAQKTNSKGNSSPSLSLRGSDVLQALQRAVTQLPKKKTTNTKKKRPQAPKNREGEPPLLHDDDDVRPINIRSDWEERIAELEARVQELQQAQYHN